MNDQESARSLWGEACRARGLSVLGDLERAALPAPLPPELRGAALVAARDFPAVGPGSCLLPGPLELYVPDPAAEPGKAKLLRCQAQFIKVLGGLGPVSVLHEGGWWHYAHEDVRARCRPGALPDLAAVFDPVLVLEVLERPVVADMTPLSAFRQRSWRQAQTCGDPEQLAELWHQVRCRPVGTLGRGINEIALWRSVGKQLGAMASAWLCGCAAPTPDQVGRACALDPADPCAQVLGILRAAARCPTQRRHVRAQSRERARR